MPEPIYQVFLNKKAEAWYQLSDEEQGRLTDVMLSSLDEVGAEVIVLCDASWSTEPWQNFGLIKFPSLEALRKHREDTNQIDWSRYNDSMSFVGTDWQTPS
jgi:hypothetical protein